MIIHDISKLKQAPIPLGESKIITLKTEDGQIFTVLERSGKISISSAMGKEIKIYPEAPNSIRIQQF